MFFKTLASHVAYLLVFIPLGQVSSGMCHLPPQGWELPGARWYLVLIYLIVSVSAWSTALRGT